jgi:cell wall-associated NlpC family hydrolase
MISQRGSSVCRVALCAVWLAALAACASHDVARATDRGVATAQRQPASIGDRAAAVALGQVGAPYRFGGNSPRGFDCSGLVHYAYANVGKNIPRTTAGLWANLEPVDTGTLKAGDLLFFNIAGKMSHVGMYVGHGQFVHAPSTGKVVSVEFLDSEYYGRALIRAGRPY